MSRMSDSLPTVSGLESRAADSSALHGAETVGGPRKVEAGGRSVCDNQVISLSHSVTTLGVQFDPHLTLNNHVKQLHVTLFCHHQNIFKVHPILTAPDAEKLAHSFISSRPEYCNGLVFGIPGKNVQDLQYNQNSVARFLMRAENSLKRTQTAETCM